MFEIVGTVYRFINTINEKSYVGSSVYFTRRKLVHVRSLENGTHHSIKLQHAWNKYGADNFVWEVLETIENVADLEPKDFVRTLLLPRESFYINHYNAAINGYNICLVAGSPLGLKRTPEFSISLSKIKKAWHAENPHISRQNSEDLIAYWSDVTKRQAHSELKKQFFIENPNAGAEHRERMQEYYEQHPEARDEMRDIKNAFHEADPQAAEEAHIRAIKQFSDPAAREAASEKALAFYNSQAEVSKREARDAIIRAKLLSGMTVREIVADTGTSAQIIIPIRQLLISEGLLSNEVSEKTRERMRKPKTEETKARMSAAQTGREVSDDAREKIRQKAIEQFSDPAARQAAADKTIAFNNSPEQVAKRELRDAPIRELLLAGYKQLDIIKKLHVSSATVGKVKNSLTTLVAA